MIIPTPLRETGTEVVLARPDWDRLCEHVEDAVDIAAAAAARHEPAIPIAVVEAEIDGAHPVAAWRWHRGLTQAGLATAAGVSRDTIANIETRRRHPSVASARRPAKGLSAPVECLIERT